MTDSDELELHKPICASTRDSSSPVWDMSQERVFIENLLNQRFSFFLVVFSLVLAGGINSKTQLHMQIVLTIGAVITGMLASVLRRSQEKLDLILADLHKDPSHPAAIIDRRSQPGGSRRRFLGIYIPRLCCTILAIGAILSWAGLLKVPGVPGK